MTKRHLISACSIAAVIALGLPSCSPGVDASQSDVLVRLGNTALTRDELCRDMPRGLSEQDSLKYSRAYIATWIENRLITEVAADEIDTKEIDRLTEDYRRQLIALEYRRLMYETHADNEPVEDSLRAYYNSHNREFILERPLVKGIYLKVPDDAPNLAVIKRLYRSNRRDDIDRLEKEVLTSAIHYDYFRDKWVDWEQIESHIPYDFGASGDKFLSGRTHFETSAGGFTYLLEINDLLPAGAIMPFENARPMITDRLNANRRREYDERLRRDLYDEALKSGKLEIFVDNVKNV